MFWKLLLLAAVIFLVVGKTRALQNPLVRLLLPRSWAMALSLIPDRRDPSPPRPREARDATIRDSPVPASPDASSTSAKTRPAWSGYQGRIILFVLFLVLVAAWLATRAMISMDSSGVPTPPGP